MPISSNRFNKSNGIANPKLLEFFVKNRSNAYALKELQQQFGANVSLELFALVAAGLYVVSESGPKWVFEVTDTLEATALLPGDSIIVLSFC
jgi:hypothetical protein